MSELISEGNSVTILCLASYFKGHIVSHGGKAGWVSGIADNAGKAPG
ncbi:hypothetical protein MNBD_CHLOROFLEXI01-4188 [hydrothermal vent metagenome]|uniref:Uncharacterized protein n=1 Tax=hydrothermal vent metagenome TaxID=652676 RepID=A0A3B0UPD8_9ZZZZ